MRILEFIERNIIDEFGSISEDELKNDQYSTVKLNWLTTAYPKV